MKWEWIVGIVGVLAGAFGLKFLGGNFWARLRRKKAIEAEQKKLDQEKEMQDAERETRRAAAHDACPFDE